MSKRLYWHRFGSLPVTVHALRDHRFRWQRIIGVQLGPWFFGAIRGQAEQPDDPPPPREALRRCAWCHAGLLPDDPVYCKDCGS